MPKYQKQRLPERCFWSGYQLRWLTQLNYILSPTDDFAKPTTVRRIETKAGIDTLTYVSGAIIWHIKRTNYNKSGLQKFIGSEVYKNMTARNVHTVRKLATLVTE